MEQRINIDYIAHEAIVARMERIINKLWIIILVLVAVLVISNAAWIWYESQFEEMTITQEAIAECQGQPNPNANTCIKLASYLIIKKYMVDEQSRKPDQAFNRTEFFF